MVRLLKVMLMQVKTALKPNQSRQQILKIKVRLKLKVQALVQAVVERIQCRRLAVR